MLFKNSRQQVLKYLKLSFLFSCVFFICCQEEPSTQFVSLSPNLTGVNFVNEIIDTNELNILNFEYIYNGGGVAIGDFNGDQLQDIFFTANMSSNALYLNKGDMQFEDISEASGITKNKRWSSGVTLVDINLDGLLDIYVSATGHDNTPNLSNLLYINQGVDENGIPTFIDQAEVYGVDDSSNSTQSVFFDYDNDGDLDLLVITNVMPEDRSPSRFRPKIKDGSSNTDDHLYENTMDTSLGHPVFKEVSEQAGILIEGFSLGVNICDINKDGWKDIYISNDYLSNDLFYINNQDGTFTDRADELFQHTSFSAMGMDVIDLDNDSNSEVIAVDMLPEDNYRRKTMLPPNNYTDYYNNEKFDFEYQFVRNTLQANNSKNGELTGEAIFSDVAFLSGVSATDWSWTPLVADFDNDMDRDIVITNGFVKDVTDRDFVIFSNDVRAYADDKFILNRVPSAKIENYAFENEGNLIFKKVSKEWGIKETSFSNGAAYGDLDNDGDLDYVVNNINDPAFIFENKNLKRKNWISVKLNGPKNNPLGIGAIVKVFAGDQQITTDFNPSRGYLSCNQLINHFGLDTLVKVDKIIIDWPGGKRSELRNQASNQTIEIDFASAIGFVTPESNQTNSFVEISKNLGIDYTHEELDIIDFNSQPLMLHKLSQYGPGLSVGDINNDGMDDLYITGSAEDKGTGYIQNKNGTFTKSDPLIYTTEDEVLAEELCALFFDADNDGDDDLYVVHGGNEFVPDSPVYYDKLYINNAGSFSADANAIPNNLLSGQAVKAADFDRDGDLDLFVGTRLVPGQYPQSKGSLILQNNSFDGKVSFSDVTKDIAPDLLEGNMITDALWTDFDNDDDLDLMITGELMGITFLENSNGNFKKSETGIENQVGIWNSIAPGDFDNDGDIDYVVGNYGTNITATISQDHPIKIYYKDFDGNGVKDVITTCFFADKDGVLQEYPYHGRSDFAKQYNSIKKKFTSHNDYAVSTINEIFSEEELMNCQITSINNLSTSIIVNQGNGKFKMTAMPSVVQRAPVYGMSVNDFDDDGNLDIAIVGNDYGAEVATGRMDALDGLIAYGDGEGKFEIINSPSTGFSVQGDAKSLVLIYNDRTSSMLLAASQNQGKLKVFEYGHKGKYVKIEPNITAAYVTLKNGKTRKQEFYFGSSFISQSSRVFHESSSIESIKY